MQVGERGQITIPKSLRDRFGLTHGVDVDVVALPDGVKISKRSSANYRFARMRGYLKDRRVIGYIDEYLKESRGR